MDIELLDTEKKRLREERIKVGSQATREKRKTQVLRVYQLKLQNLKAHQQEKLTRLFLEAKWFYNHIVADIDNRLTPEVWKLKVVSVKVGDQFEDRPLTILPAQCRQALRDRVFQALKSLKVQRVKGHKVGALKPKREVRSVPLPQFKVTYDINLKENKVQLPKIGWVRALGLRQIPPDAEFANATLIKRPSGFYVYVTVFLPKQPHQPIFDKPIGIDLGIKAALTLSNGLQIDFAVPETKRLKRLQRQLARKQKGSKNWHKTLMKLQREHEYIANCRRDCLNKIIAFLKCYSKVCVQEDYIKGWHENGFGRKVQWAGIGGCMTRMKNILATLTPIPRFTPTTAQCSECNATLNVTLSDRMIVCSNCGIVVDRDLNAARNILRLGLSLNQSLPLGWREVTPVEWMTAVRILGSNPYIRISRHDEAGSRQGDPSEEVTEGKEGSGRCIKDGWH
jgi:transposase